MNNEQKIRKLTEALEYYAGNFDGREGTKWNGDIFFIETKFGSTDSAEGGKLAREVLEAHKQGE